MDSIDNNRNTNSLQVTLLVISGQPRKIKFNSKPLENNDQNKKKKKKMKIQK